MIMLKRRDFLRNSGAMAIGGLLMKKNIADSFFTGAEIPPAGLQLYTLFNLMDEDVAGSLKKIAAIGYKEIESAFSRKGGYYGMSPKEFAALVKNSGLSWQSHHVLGAPFRRPAGARPMTGPDGKPISIPLVKNLKENAQQLVDEAAEGGVHYLVCASIPLGKADEIKAAIEILNKTGEAAKKAGITLAYHNHTHEFDTVDGLIPYEMLLTQTSPDILKFELDLGWATKAGADPLELFKKNPGRFPLWHVKDLDKDTKQPTEVGNGYVDFKRIFSGSETAGLKHFFVEQDGAPKPFENIATSYNNLKKILA